MQTDREKVEEGLLMDRSVPWSGPVCVPPDGEAPAMRNWPERVPGADAFVDRVPIVMQKLDGLRDRRGYASFGTARPSPAAQRRLMREIRKLEKGGHKVSLAMADLAHMSGLGYRSELTMCTQSTIKAVYCGALLDMHPGAFQENGQYIHDAVVYSENEPYHLLRAIYGDAPMLRWCREAGVRDSYAHSLYPRDGNAREMLKLWGRLYRFLNGGQDRNRYGACLADTSASAARKQLGGRFAVQSKAGWEMGLDESRNYDPHAEIPPEYRDGDPSNDECAINDTGIVYTDAGPYLFAVFTDHPFGIFRDYATPNPLYGLTEAILGAQQSLGEGRNRDDSHHRMR